MEEKKTFRTMKVWWKTWHRAKMEAAKRGMTLVRFMDYAVKLAGRQTGGGE